MTAIPFDTLKFLEKLTSAGVSTAQAKAQVDILTEIHSAPGVITETNFKESEAKLEAKIDKLDIKVDKKIDKLDIKIDKVEMSLKNDIMLVKNDTTTLKWILGFIIASNMALVSKTFFNF